MPVLHSQPVEGVCALNSGPPVRCTLMRSEDWDAVLLYAKAKCLETGGTPAACQTAAP